MYIYKVINQTVINLTLILPNEKMNLFYNRFYLQKLRLMGDVVPLRAARGQHALEDPDVDRSR